MKRIYLLNFLRCSLGLGMTLFAISSNAQTHDSSILDSVTVSVGQYQPQSMRQSVYQVRVIGQQFIQTSGATNVQQLLRNQLGFRFSNDNTLGVSDVELMGMSGRSVKILLDGVPLVDRNDTKESLNQIDVNTIDRIEIVEGPMSVSYGSDALAGVINIITKNGSANRWFVGAQMQEETAGSEYSPLGNKGTHFQNLNAGFNSGKWRAQAGVTHNDFQGFGGDAYGRAKTWRPKDQWMTFGKIGFVTKRINLYYRLDALDETITVKNAINLQNTQDINAVDQKYITHRYLHQVQGQWDIASQWKLSGIVSYTDYERKTITTKKDFATGTTTLTTGAGEQDVAGFKYFIFRPTIVYVHSNQLSFQYGWDLNRESANGDRIAGHHSITEYAMFLSSEIKPNNWLNIRPGLRFIKNSVYDAPPVIPSINTKLTLNKNMDLRLAYAHGFRSPALRELYFNFIDANHIIIGNPDLKAETSNSVTGSLSWSGLVQNAHQWKATLNTFYNAFHNQVNYGYKAGSGDTTTLLNIDKFKTTGGTIEVFSIWKNLNISLGFSYIGRYNSLKNDTLYRDQVTNFSFTPEVNTNIIYTCPKSNTTLNFSYKYTGKRPGFQTSGTEVQKITIGDFHWSDAALTQPVCWGFKISGGVKNIFNVSDIVRTGTVSNAAHSEGSNIPMGYGRSYFLGIQYQFSKILKSK